jgi:hypothetical protein
MASWPSSQSTSTVLPSYSSTGGESIVQTTDLMLARGDMDGKLVWLAILRALKELERTERRRGEAVN